MGDIKVCPSCGHSIPAAAAFCPNCGHKQEVVPTPEPEKAARPAEASAAPQADENQISESLSAANPVEASEVVEQPEQNSQQPSVEATAQEQPVSSDSATAAPQHPVSPKPEPTQQQSYTQGYPQPQQQTAFRQQAQPAQGYPFNAQQAQQPAAPQKPKKKFPWVFTILWAGMLIFIGVWIFLWFTYPESQNPLNTLTVDTFRILTPALAIVILIYMLNLKLIVKKGKVIPTILLAIALVITVFMFLSFELVDGDWAHDLIKPVTEIFFEFE